MIMSRFLRRFRKAVSRRREHEGFDRPDTLAVLIEGRVGGRSVEHATDARRIDIPARIERFICERRIGRRMGNIDPAVLHDIDLFRIERVPQILRKVIGRKTPF